MSWQSRWEKDALFELGTRTVRALTPVQLYLLLRQASARLAQTELEDLRIGSVKE